MKHICSINIVLHVVVMITTTFLTRPVTFMMSLTKVVLDDNSLQSLCSQNGSPIANVTSFANCLWRGDPGAQARASRGTKNLLKCTYSKVEFQKMSGGNTPGPPPHRRKFPREIVTGLPLSKILDPPLLFFTCNLVFSPIMG